MHHIVPYTLQQNGVAERKNCTLKEMIVCFNQKDLLFVFGKKPLIALIT